MFIRLRGKKRGQIGKKEERRKRKKNTRFGLGEGIHTSINGGRRLHEGGIQAYPLPLEEGRTRLHFRKKISSSL